MKSLVCRKHFQLLGWNACIAGPIPSGPDVDWPSGEGVAAEAVEAGRAQPLAPARELPPLQSHAIQRCDTIACLAYNLLSHGSWERKSPEHKESACQLQIMHLWHDVQTRCHVDTLHRRQTPQPHKRHPNPELG